MADDQRQGAVQDNLYPACNVRLSLSVALLLAWLRALIRRMVATACTGREALQVVWPLCRNQSHLRNQPKEDETIALRTVSVGVASADDDEEDVVVDGGFRGKAEWGMPGDGLEPGALGSSNKRHHVHAQENAINHRYYTASYRPDQASGRSAVRAIAKR